MVCLLVCGLSACIRMDVGNTIGSMGKRVPKVVPFGELPVRVAEVFRRDGRYFVSLPVVYVPERRCGVEFVPQLVGDFEFLDGMGGDGGGTIPIPVRNCRIIRHGAIMLSCRKRMRVSLLPILQLLALMAISGCISRKRYV